jgi:hypothetical protein
VLTVLPAGNAFVMPHEAAPAGESFLQVFPMYLRRGAKVEGLTFSFLPWGCPGLSAATGTTSGIPAEQLLVLGYEWPVPWLRPTSRLLKADIEALHLLRYAADHRLALGAHAFTEPIAGDAPDFKVTVGGATMGLDCAAVAVQERRQAHSLFVNLRQRIVQNPVAFGHLGGFMIYLWFPDQNGIQLPFHVNDDSAIQELLQALASYTPAVHATTLSGTSLPEQLPEFGMVETTLGAAFYAVPFRSAVPDTAFASVMGFDLGFAFTTEHSSTSTWRELERLVVQHDKPGTDWLLLSAGAPNAEGLTFPTEELVARLLIEHPQSLRPTVHISRVTLHIWSTGEAFEILPKVSHGFGPLYVGAVPAHKVIHPSDT